MSFSVKGQSAGEKQETYAYIFMHIKNIPESQNLKARRKKKQMHLKNLRWVRFCVRSFQSLLRLISKRSKHQIILIPSLKLKKQAQGL